MAINNLNIGILRNEDPASADKWVLACEKLGLRFEIIDITDPYWLDKVHNIQFDFFLLKPPGVTEHFKKLYDERIYIISQILGYRTYPSYKECYIYENKKLLSDFLKASDLPHPHTKVFYKNAAAYKYLDNASFPVVAKTSTGASGSGVTILRSKKQGYKYVRKAFSSKGIKRQFGPNRVIGTPVKWFKKAIKNPSLLFSKIKGYLNVYRHGEKEFVLFQNYVPHDFEWRAVRIGNSYFAHKKIKYKDKASGSKGIEYVTPPEKLLDFVRNVCEKLDFNFMAIDMFEDSSGGYLINELQTLFGHVQDHILAVEGKPGRYILRNNEWLFEEGDFNTNESYDLRLLTALSLFEKEKI